MSVDGLADLWVDGRVYRVPPAVVAHVKFLSDLNARLAERAVQYAQEAIALRAELQALRTGRAA